MVEKRIVAVSVDTFRSRLIPAAAVLCTLAALFSIGAAAALLMPGSVDTLTEDLMLGGISDPDALQMWKLIHISVTVASALCSTVMAVCLILVLMGKIGKGLDLLHDGAQWLLRAVKVAGVLALVVLAFRLLLYMVLSFSRDDGVYYLFAMLLYEGLLVAAVWFLYRQLRTFLSCICDSTMSMACTFVTGELDDVSIPGFTATGFLILCFFNLAIGVDRMFTLTVVHTYLEDYYWILIADDPLLYLSAIALLLSAAVDLMLYFYLRRYKRISERLLYRPLRSEE